MYVLHLSICKMKHIHSNITYIVPCITHCNTKCRCCTISMCACTALSIIHPISLKFTLNKHHHSTSHLPNFQDFYCFSLHCANMVFPKTSHNCSPLAAASCRQKPLNWGFGNILVHSMFWLQQGSLCYVPIEFGSYYRRLRMSWFFDSILEVLFHYCIMWFFMILFVPQTIQLTDKKHDYLVKVL